MATPLARYFGFNEPIDRKTYLHTGVVLMVAKYAIDATAIFLVTHQLWTPADYLLPLISIRDTKVAAFPTWLLTALILWTLPFIWIGVSMTLRRAIDAAKSPWYSLLFFLPLINYAVMLWLASVPSAEGPTPRWLSDVQTTATGRVRSALIGILVSVVIGSIAVAIITLTTKSYGMALFLGTPFVLGAVTAYIHNYRHPRTSRETTAVVMLGLFFVGGSLMLFALEGLVCLLMAVPIGIVAAELGGKVGRLVAIGTTAPPASTAFVLLLLPAGLVADRATNVSPVYEAVTSVIVNAPPEKVWAHVIQFHEITERPSLLFRLGIAYPIRARISGTGPGAIRRCEFSTGAFVEPITAWEAPNKLSFGVSAQPPAMHELSPYSHVYAPHIKGFFRARRGEFRLVSLSNGRTRLEGSTWYTLDMYPQAYWRPIAELLLRQIHERVLEQVKRESEE